MTVISISLPEAMVADLDQALEARAFAGRSELIRAAVRDFLGRERRDASHRGPRSASLTLVYRKGVERRIGLTRHDYGDVVKSMMHTDADDSCVELFLLQGPMDRVQELADRFRGDRDVRVAQLVLTDGSARGGSA